MLTTEKDKRTDGFKFNFLEPSEIKEAMSTFINEVSGDEEKIRNKHNMSNKGTIQDLFKLQQEYDLLLVFDRHDQVGYIYFDPQEKADSLPD